MSKERAKAQALRKSNWWQGLIQNGHCYYCRAEVDRITATMDHIVPISQGGRSTKSNIVVSCKSCNTKKRNLTAVEWLLEQEAQPSR